MFKSTFNGEYTPKLIIEYLKQNGITFINSLPTDINTTLDDVIAYCHGVAQIRDENIYDFSRLIKDAVASGYDKRYLNHRDERKIYYDEFKSAFQRIIQDFNFDKSYYDLDILVVGIGNGSECDLLYSDVKNITLVDIAPKSLENAMLCMPKARCYLNYSNELSSISNLSTDLYISLRTYQSTFFDITSSLNEAVRVLRNSGGIIISVACGYIDNGHLLYGLINPYTGLLEHDRPDFFVDKISHAIKQLGLTLIGKVRTSTEIFLYARKS